MIMKIRVFFFLAGLMLAISGQAQVVGPEEASRAAGNWYTERGGYHSGSVTVKEVIPLDKEGEILLYAVNFYPKGFVLISAHKGMVPVAAYSFESWYQADPQPENARAWIHQYLEEASDAFTTGRFFDSLTFPEWERLLTGNITSGIKFSGKAVEPLTVANWNQDWPYNEMCPADPSGPHGHCYAGCVPTAMGMIMYYYRWPDSGTGYYSYTQAPYGLLEADFGNTKYRWEEMTNSISDSDSAIAELLYHLGVSCDLVYGPNGSGMYNHRSAYALKTFFRYSPETRYVYRDSTQMNWDSILVAHLDRKMPMYYAGWSVPNINGHAFVCDGYQGTGYFHFNFGWGGSFNGYYYTGNLTPGGSNFNLAQEVIINCHPDTTHYTYPLAANGNDTLKFRVGSLDDGSGPRYPAAGNDAQWLISPQNSQDSVSSIRLQFHRFDLGTGSAVVNVYDGPTTASALLGSFTGSVLPPSVESSGNQMLVAATGLPSSGADGYFATYESEFPDWCSGSVTLTEPAGLISDGSGDFFYYNSTVCLWKIIPPAAEEVALYFEKFSTESGFDRLKVFDFGSGALLADYSGQYGAGNMPPPVLSPSGKMFITFNTNGSVREDGFLARYESYFTSRDEREADRIYLFPNPANTISHIRIPAGKVCERVEIWSLDGRMVRADDPVSQDQGWVSLDVSSLSSGLYMVKARIQGRMYTTKLIR